eukprot:1162135-Pelagomonas_calceolata.AAC.1
MDTQAELCHNNKTACACESPKVCQATAVSSLCEPGMNRSGVASDAARETEHPQQASRFGNFPGALKRQLTATHREGPQHLASSFSDNLPGVFKKQPSSSHRDHKKRGEAQDRDTWGVKGSQGKKEVRSPGGSLKSKKPSGAVVRADKKKQKIATELRCGQMLNALHRRPVSTSGHRNMQFKSASHKAVR